MKRPSDRRLLYVLDRFPSYTLNFIYNEIRVLEEAGFRIALYSLLPATTCPAEARDYLARTCNVRPVPWRGFLRAWFHYLRRRPRRLLGMVLRLPLDNDRPAQALRTLAHLGVAVYFAWLIRDHGEHLHAHFAHKAALAAHVASRLNGNSYSFTAHGSHTVYRAKRLCLRSKVRHAAFVLAVSEFNRRTLLSLYPDYPPGRVAVSRCGVLLDQYPFTERGPCTPGPSRLVCIASFYPIKNHETLLGAASLLASRGVDFRLDLVGGDAEDRRQRLTRLADQLGIGERVRFHGVVDHGEIARYLRAADLAVLASLSEGIPVSLMEAMALGTPVLGPRVTGLPELVEDGVTGLLADPRRTEEFAARIAEILADTGRAREMARRARRHIEMHYDMTANSRARAELFADFLATRDGLA
ncbi:MAG: glycosyltransferase [Candidatus Krumholzibacteriota bacterium]|nr:glycosyltransferase [Candidatus Krumholzibacteriota bacterium]